MKQPNICTKGIPEVVETDNGLESLLSKIIAEVFPNVEKERSIRAWEAHRTLNRHDGRKSPSKVRK